MSSIVLKSGKEIKLNQAFNVDCLEFMKELPDKCIDLVLTDPPYGINQGGGTNSSRCKKAISKDYKDYDDKHPLTKEHFQEMKRISKNQIYFGANHYISLIPFDSSSWLVWDKLKGKQILQIVSLHIQAIKLLLENTNSVGKGCYKGI